MNLRGRIPVEPLDEERVVNVERRVVAGYADAMASGRATGGARWMMPALAAAAAAAVVAAVLVWKLRPAPQVVTPAVAAVRVEATPGGSRVELGDATIAVAPGGSFVVTRPGGGVLVALDAGKVELEVASRKGRAPLVVRAGDVDVVVVGTKFSVERAAEVVVTVTEGVVSVQRGGDAVRVAAGERWAAPAQVAAGTPMPAVEAITVATADPTNPTSPTIPSDDIEMSSGDDGGPALHGRDTVVPPVPGVVKSRNDTTPPRHDTTTGAGSDAGAGSGSGSGAGAGAGAGGMDVIRKVRLDAVARPVDVSGTGNEAIAAYKAMLDTDALSGFYGLAYAYKAQGNSSEAMRYVNAYITRNPNGPEIESVLWMRIQLTCKQPIDSKCRRAANAYKARFSSGTRAELALELSNSMD